MIPFHQSRILTMSMRYFREKIYNGNRYELLTTTTHVLLERCAKHFMEVGDFLDKYGGASFGYNYLCSRARLPPRPRASTQVIELVFLDASENNQDRLGFCVGI